MNIPKVSIIMPSLNVASYIRECIESAINQTLNDIEIICVDAGSTDGTLEILQEYAQRDNRIKIIISDKKSYGYQMNLGLDAATGTYIGILETDDWIDADMYETLWKTAVEHNADMVKANYYWYTTQNGIQNVPFENLKKCPYNKCFSPINTPAFFETTPAIWSGIYQRELLFSNCVRFNETPGASFQDTSFHFILATISQRCYLINKFFLHYRKDNDASSVHSQSKVYCIADEMHYYEAFLASHIQLKESIIKHYQALKYEKYRWNYARLPQNLQYEFLKLMHKEFLQAHENGWLHEAYFSATAWNDVTAVVHKPVRFFRETQRKKEKEQGYAPTSEAVLLKQATNPSPVVSVIIPFFNVESYLEECIQSVLNQTYESFEIICVDDGSWDNSAAIVEKYASLNSKFTVVSQVNKGQSSARNTGLLFARGQYIYFLDSDDLLLPDAFTQLLTYAEKWDTDILYFGAESFFENDNLKLDHSNYANFYKRKPAFDTPVSGDICLLDQLKNWLFRCSVPLQLIRKDFLQKTGILFKEGITHEDELFSCLLAAKAERVLCIKDALYMRRIRANSTMTSDHTAEKFVGFFIVSTTLMSVAVTDNSLTRIAREAIIFHANKIQKDAKITYSKLDKNEKAKIPELLPFEYLPYYHEMQFSFEGSNNDLVAIKTSASYKIGLAITLLPRKICGFVHCIKDHGMFYTMRYSVIKVFKLFCTVSRKIRAKFNGGLQCCKDHGVAYTIQYFFSKLLHRK